MQKRKDYNSLKQDSGEEMLLRYNSLDEHPDITAPMVIY